MKKIAVFGLVMGLACSTTVFADPFYVQNMQEQWSVIEEGKIVKKIDKHYKKIEVLFPNLLLVQNNKNEIGLVTKDFVEISPMGKYDSIGEWRDGYAIAQKKDEEGMIFYAVIDKNGKEIVPLLQYMEVKRILNNTAISVISEDQQKVFIYNNKMELLNQIMNRTDEKIQKVEDYSSIFVIGKKAYNKKAKEIRELKEFYGMVRIGEYNPMFFVDRVFVNSTSFLVDSITGKEYGEFKKIKLQEKYAIVEDENGIGIIGEKGKICVKTGLYDTISTLTYYDYGYNQQYLCVTKKDKVGIIHYTGKIIVPIGKYKNIKEIIKNVFYVEDNKRNSYYISKSGEKLSYLRGYGYDCFLNKDRAMSTNVWFPKELSLIDTNTNKKIYTLSKKGNESKIIVEDKRIENAPKGTMLVCDYQNDVMRILNKSGKTIVKKGVFTILDSFDGTYIVDITPKGTYRVITKTGKEIIKPLYDNIENQNGYFYATKGSKMVIFDKKGKIVVKLGSYLDIAR